jgi:hypothetical protein
MSKLYDHEVAYEQVRNAAPDLLEALEALDDRVWFIIGINDPAIAKSRAAIAKATGK